MPSLERRDERADPDRQVRPYATHVPRDSQRDPIHAARRGGRDVYDALDHDEDDDEDDDDDDDEGKEEGMHAPRVTRRGRATPSVSFSEPVETPPARRGDPMALPTPSPSSPSARVARRSRNRLETRLAELQRDVANLSMRLRASSVASQKSASFQDDDGDGGGTEVAPTFPVEYAEVALRDASAKPAARGVVSRREIESNGHKEPVRGAGETGLAAKSPARTILKKTTTKTTTLLETDPMLRNATSQKARSRSRGRGGELGEEDEENNPYRANTRGSHLMENGRDREERPLRVRATNGQPEQPRSAKEMLRIVRELRVVAVERDQLRYELDQTKRSLAALEKKYQDAAKWKEAHDKMKAHCDSLQESLDLSEKIRIRQKRLLQQLQQTVQLDESAKMKSRHHATQRVDVLDSVLHGTSIAGAQPRRTTTTRLTDNTRTSTRLAGSTRNTITKQSSAAVNTSTRSYSRSDFDSLLQVPIPERSIAGSTLYRRSSQPKKEPVPSRTVASSRAVHPKSTAAVTSSSRSTRPTQAARSSHFLAPTQASLNQASKRRTETSRPPFVV